MLKLQNRRRKGVKKIVVWAVLAIGAAVMIMVAIFLMMNLLGEASISASGGS